MKGQLNNYRLKFGFSPCVQEANTKDFEKYATRNQSNLNKENTMAIPFCSSTPGQNRGFVLQIKVSFSPWLNGQVLGKVCSFHVSQKRNLIPMRQALLPLCALVWQLP